MIDVELNAFLDIMPWCYGKKLFVDENSIRLKTVAEKYGLEDLVREIEASLYNRSGKVVQRQLNFRPLLFRYVGNNALN